jgi:hypothetical protein
MVSAVEAEDTSTRIIAREYHLDTALISQRRIGLESEAQLRYQECKIEFSSPEKLVEHLKDHGQHSQML